MEHPRKVQGPDIFRGRAGHPRFPENSPRPWALRTGQAGTLHLCRAQRWWPPLVALQTSSTGKLLEQETNEGELIFNIW